MRILIVVALAALLGGCASATRGWNEQISIASTPSGAEAVVSGLEPPLACVTPCVVQVPRSANITVSFDKPGYEPKIVPLSKEIAGTGAVGFAGNLLLGGVIGMGVDAASGATLDHKPNPVIVELQPIPRPAPPPVVIQPERPRRKPKPPTS